VASLTNALLVVLHHLLESLINQLISNILLSHVLVKLLVLGEEAASRCVCEDALITYSQLRHSFLSRIRCLCFFLCVDIFTQFVQLFLPKLRF